MRDYIYLLMTCALFLFATCSSPSQHTVPIDEIPSDKEGTIVVDGDLNDWTAVQSLFKTSAFSSPWADTIGAGSTIFQAFADSTWFYFCFVVEDRDVIVSDFFQEELDVAEGDRVELFFAGDTALTEYYCLEISPRADILDYRAVYYRHFDEEWNLTDLSAQAAITESGYVVEGKLPIRFLNSVGSQSSSGDLTLWLGIYRAQYSVHAQDPQSVQWLTWQDPRTADPDFHVPRSFRQIIIKRN